MTTTFYPPSTRVRTDGGFTRRPYVYTYWAGTNYGNGGYVGSYRWMRDTLTKRFLSRSRNGEIVMNGYKSLKSSSTSEMISNISGEWNLGSNPRQLYSDSGDLTHLCTGYSLQPTVTSGIGFNLIPDDELAALVSQVSTRCISQIGRTSANNWENLAEIGKTFGMLEKPLASWFKFSRKAKLATAGLSAANAWLQYRYGIRPLVSSVDATLKQYASLASRKAATRVTTRDSGKISRDTSDTFTTTTALDGTNKYTVLRERRQVTTVRAMSLDTASFGVTDSLGLGSKDLLTLPWELIPYSFVVDWFVNVGDFIGAIAQSAYPASLGRCYTVTEEFSETRTTLTCTPYASNNIIYAPRLGRARTELTQKTRVPGLPSPSIVVKSDFRFDNLTRLADAFALSGQQLLRVFSTRR